MRGKTMRGGEIKGDTLPKPGAYICGSTKAPDSLKTDYEVVPEPSDPKPTSATRLEAIKRDNEIKVLYNANQTFYFINPEKVPVDRSILVKPVPKPAGS
jgi:hypothetical protein